VFLPGFGNCTVGDGPKDRHNRGKKAFGGLYNIEDDMRILFQSLLLSVTLAVAALITSLSPVAAQDNYVIRSGDTLQIEVLEDPSLNRTALVLPDGSISFPMAGTVAAKGRSVDQLRQNLSAALAPNFAVAPNVYVSVASLGVAKPKATGGSSRMDVYALGEFEAPGLKEVKRGTTLLQFIAQSGGLSRFAADKRIELLRTDKNGNITTYLFNMRTPAGGETGISGSTVLTTGDVIKAPQRRLFE
jgi:polysaccharide export outer membrane protein